MFLKTWAARIDPMYMMASSPADFEYGQKDSPREPGWPTATELIDLVLVPTAENQPAAGT